LLPSTTPRGELKIAPRSGDAGFVLLGFGGGLALAQFGHRLFEHFGMRDQVVLDDGLDLAALGIGEALRRSGQRRAAQREREQGGSEQAERRHWQILMRRSGFRERPARRTYGS
jgi:hypothetical protein